MVRYFIFFWRILFVVGVTGELLAFTNTTSDDTLSERVARWQQTFPIFRWLLLGFMVWLTYHFATATVADGQVSFRWAGRELLQIWAVAVVAYVVVCGFNYFFPKGQ